MNKTSVLLAFVANPFLAVFMKNNYLNFWKDEVDEVLININGRNKMIVDFIVSLWNEDNKVKFIDVVDREMRQGDAFDRIYPKATGDILMTIDSDNYVYKKGVVSRYVNWVREGKFDAIGSRGHHAYPAEVSDILVNKYGIIRLNPFMSFWRRDLVEKMDVITFRTYNYKAGEKFEPIGTFLLDGWMDCMARFSLQYWQFTKNYKVIDPTFQGEYVHMSGVSSVFRRNFKGLEDNDGQKYNEKHLNKQKIYFWALYYLLYEATKNEIPFEDYKKEYERGFEYILKESDIPLDYVKTNADEFKGKHKPLFVRPIET